MLFDPGNAQHPGSRPDQQDAFAFSDPADVEFVSHGGLLAVVADGMGGLKNGAVASRTAVKTLVDAYRAKDPRETIPAALERSIEKANAAVHDLARQMDAQGEMGTTAVAAVVHEGGLHWIAAGDSALFLVREGNVDLLTAAHTYARELESAAAAGRISESEARNHPQRESLISFLGAAKIAAVDRSVQPLALQAGDRVLLATDGLFKTLDQAEIAAAIYGPGLASSQDACHRLILAAVAKGRPRQDNITVAMLGFPAPAPAPSPAAVTMELPRELARPPQPKSWLKWFRGRMR